MSNAAPPPTDDDAPLPLGRRRPADDELDITPMIDITFLLLIFFVVASKMDPTQAAATPKATHGLSVAAKDSVVIFMRRGSGETAEVAGLEGSVTRAFSSDQDEQPSEIVDYITAALEREQKGQVMILGDFDVSVGEVSRVRRIIGDAFEDLPSTYIAVKEE